MTLKILNKIVMLLVVIFAIRVPLSADQKKDFSLIISGGISLGAYEAGYNWALLKYLNYQKHADINGTEVKLHSIAGASAGAINTMMSAMAWCYNHDYSIQHNLIDNNLFHNMWTKVDFEDLFIDKSFGVNDKQNSTSLFSRQKLETLSSEMFHELNQPYYEPGCSIPFGITVTRVEPKIAKIQNIEIANKLFQIPLLLNVNQEGKAIIEDNPTLERDNIIHLSHNGFPTNERIKKALFASSAFPIAFEQVELGYFHHDQFERALFQDGGVFDNIPLDFAVRLSQEQATNYIFMDPAHFRRTLPPKEFKEEREISPLNSAIYLLGDIFSASKSSILYNTLAEEFQDERKQIELSSRYFPITGKFLRNFGAFLDQGFREYDYYVGVYDAIVESAKYDCNQGEKSCIQGREEYLYNLLSQGSNRAKYLLNLLHSEEFGYPFESTVYPRENDLYSIFDSIKSLNYQDTEEFYRFIEALNNHKYKATNGYLKHTLKHPNEWYRQSLASMMHRIVSLEKKNSSNLTKALATVTAYGAGSFYRTKSGYTYNPVSAPLDYDKFWVKYFPYEFAFTPNVVALGYENYYYFNSDNGFIPKAIEIKPSASFWYNNKEEHPNFLRVDFNLNYELKPDMYTVGFGPSFFYNLEKFSEEQEYFGTNIYFDFLNILRATYVERDHESFVYIGINDIPSFVYWITD